MEKKEVHLSCRLEEQGESTKESSYQNMHELSMAIQNLIHHLKEDYCLEASLT